MKPRLSKLALVAATCFGVALFAYAGWKRSAKLIPRMTQVSPDGKYRIEFYSVWTPTFIAFPGQGSDGIDGFVRFMHKDGRLIKETFRAYLYGCETSWDADSVALLGDDFVEWKFPK